MGVLRLRGGRGIELDIPPVGFSTSCDIEATLPPGIPDIEERLACARLSCRTGVEQVGIECLACDHYSGWRDGPGLAHVTVQCAWSSRARVEERMTPASALITIAPSRSCQDADDLAVAANVRHLAVVDEGVLVGVLCRCALHPMPPEGTRVGERMSRDIIAVTRDVTLGQAAAAMARFGVGCLPVIEGGAPVGILTRGDLLRCGVPQSLVGGGRCDACGSRHGVQLGPHSCEELCLSCLELADELFDESNFGQGD